MHVLIVRNPKSGRGRQGLEPFKKELIRFGAKVTVRELKPKERLSHALGDAKDFDRIVIAGGDGTVSNAAYALRNTGIPIMVYPAGTANLLASNLKMPSNPEDLARTAILGQIIDIDIAELELRKPVHPHDIPEKIGFVLNAGAGLDAEIVAKAKPLKPKLKDLSYLVAALRCWKHPSSTFTLEIDGQTIQETAVGILIVNFGKLHFDLPLVKSSEPQDGQLEVIIIKPSKHLVQTAIKAILSRKGVESPDVQETLVVRFGKRIKVISDPPVALQRDGELSEYTTPFEAIILPKAVRFVVP